MKRSLEYSWNSEEMYWGIVNLRGIRQNKKKKKKTLY